MELPLDEQLTQEIIRRMVVRLLGERLGIERMISVALG